MKLDKIEQSRIGQNKQMNRRKRAKTVQETYGIRDTHRNLIKTS